MSSKQTKEAESIRKAIKILSIYLFNVKKNAFLYNILMIGKLLNQIILNKSIKEITNNSNIPIRNKYNLEKLNYSILHDICS